MNLHTKTRPSFERLFAAVVAGAWCLCAGAVDAPLATGEDQDAWSLPAWMANDQPVQGTFVHGDVPSPEAVRIRYQINDGESRDAETDGSPSAESGIKFELPKLDYDTFGSIRLWAEDATSGKSIGEPRTIAIADWHEFDITGQTAIELLFPMQSWHMQVRFTPCCLILGGYLRVERIPINPVDSAAGLPETLASYFLNLAPDPTVVATSGLNADIEIDPESPLAKTPESVTVYTWFKGRWSPVRGAELHAETNTIRFKALEGGFFVLGPKPAA